MTSHVTLKNKRALPSLGMILIRATQLTFFATFCGVNEKNDKIRNGSINCFNESPCLTSNNPSLRGMRVRRRGKRDYGARERARNMMLDLNE